MDDFARLFDEHYAAVARALTLAIGDRGRAEEMTQEAFTRAWRQWRKVSTMQRPVAWLFVVALNAERTRWRREQREAALIAEPPVVGDAASAVLTKVVLREALLRLPARQRVAVVLRYFSDLSVSEIARVMGSAEGTVKATLHHALANLRVDLEGVEP